MKQCGYTFAITYARCRACNGLDSGCRCYTPTEQERARRGEPCRTAIDDVIEAVEGNHKQMERLRREPKRRRAAGQ